VGSKTFDGVWFISYAHDHLPPHVHGAYAETVVIIDLLPNGIVRKADRWNAITPRNAKSSDVKKILDVAAENAEALWKLWETMHG